jgi:fructose-specific phosphotransferase system IIC component
MAIAAMMPMIATTISNSISVKPLLSRILIVMLLVKETVTNGSKGCWLESPGINAVAPGSRATLVPSPAVFAKRQQPVPFKRIRRS